MIASELTLQMEEVDNGTHRQERVLRNDKDSEGNREGGDKHAIPYYMDRWVNKPSWVCYFQTPITFLPDLIKMS